MEDRKCLFVIDEGRLKRCYVPSGTKKIEIPEGIRILEHGGYFEYVLNDSIFVSKECKITDLEEFYLPDSLDCILDEALSDIIRLPSLKKNYYSNGYYLGSKSNPFMVLVSIKDKSVSSFSFHPDCQIIAARTFLNCSNLESIVIPPSIQDLGEYAFSHCKRLKSVIFEGSLDTIRDSCFNDCSSLKSIRFPKDLDCIEMKAFCDCTSLEEITIPEGVTTIICAPFEGCTNLRHLILPDTLDFFDGLIGDNTPNLVFNYSNYGEYLGSKDNPYLILMRAPYPSKIKIEDSCRFIHFRAFLPSIRKEDSALTKVIDFKNIENPVTIDLINLPNLEKLIFSNQPHSLNAQCFYGCTSLKEIEVRSTGAIQRLMYDL